MSDPSGWLLVWPVLVPILASALCVMAWGRMKLQAQIGAAGIVLQFGCSVLLLISVLSHGPFAMSMGNWAAPFGIALAADTLGALLTVTASGVALVIVVNSFSISSSSHRRSGFFPLTLALMSGVAGAFLTSDIFNLYVWFEVTLIATFGLMVLGGQRERLDAAVKYAFLNMIATTLLLIAIGLLYGLTGTLNMADLSGKISAMPDSVAIETVALLFLVAFAMKSAVFPLAFWLPASYHAPMQTISALFGALLTKVGIYSLIRVFTLVFPETAELAHQSLIWLAAGTMVVAALGTLAETDIRRFVSFTVMGGVGVMLFGLALGTTEALAASTFYVIHSMIISAALFIGVGLMIRKAGTHNLYELSGLYKAAPALSVAMLLCGLSLAGVPPFAGFWPKVMLIQAALADASFAGLAALLAAGFLTLMTVGRLFAIAFWREVEGQNTAANGKMDQSVWALASLAGITILLGVWPDPVLTLAQGAAGGLLDPTAYIQAVLPSQFAEVSP